MMKKAIAWFLVLTLVWSSLAFMACGGQKDQSTCGQVEEKTTRPEEKVEKYGRGWGDVPLYPGASVAREEGQMTVPAAARGEYEKVEHRWHETSDSWEKVHEYYLREMAEKGWHKLFAMKYPEGSGVSVWMKDDGDRGCAISAGVRDDGLTHIGLLLNEGKK